MSLRNLMRGPVTHAYGRGASRAAWVRWHDMGWHTLLVGLMLVGVGLLFLYEMALADELQNRAGIRFGSHVKKLMVASPGLVLGLLARPSWLRRHAWALYAASIALLVAVALFGDERNNARRWIETPVFDVQPSEFAKLALILVLARVLHRRRLARASEWLAPGLCLALPMALVTLQPDLGTAMTMVPVALGMCYLAGARGTLLVSILLVGAGLGLGAWQGQIGVKDYQLERIDTWYESIAAPALIDGKQGPGFHAYHARLAPGNGGLFGTGLGQGIANETGILPERESDSVFAVIAEESGFVGGVAVLLLFGLLVLLLMAGAAEVRDRFVRLVVGGVAIYFAAHVFVHVAVNLGLLPMTGLTLPLISTGGSSLLVSLLALGLAVGLSANQEPSLDSDAFRRY
ncbi:MAG: FtsW/RodA/SpoVE family cell cycle protein [bacterium]|nr:rod shape-determining protein RodA [Planctomycetota bacterium]HIL51972.1 rod shape-determining protein RodA [Planctomycetota bacterium]